MEVPPSEDGSRRIASSGVVLGRPADLALVAVEAMTGSLLPFLRESGGDFAMAVGRGTDNDPDAIVDVQIAARGDAAASLVDAVENWQRLRTGQNALPPVFHEGDRCAVCGYWYWERPTDEAGWHSLVPIRYADTPELANTIDWCGKCQVYSG